MDQAELGRLLKLHDPASWGLHVARTAITLVVAGNAKCSA